MLSQYRWQISQPSHHKVALWSSGKYIHQTSRFQGSTSDGILPCCGIEDKGQEEKRRAPVPILLYHVPVLPSRNS